MGRASASLDFVAEALEEPTANAIMMARVAEEIGSTIGKISEMIADNSQQIREDRRPP